MDIFQPTPDGYGYQSATIRTDKFKIVFNL
jgi:hypothetical protein